MYILCTTNITQAQTAKRLRKKIKNIFVCQQSRMPRHKSCSEVAKARNLCRELLAFDISPDKLLSNDQVAKVFAVEYVRKKREHKKKQNAKRAKKNCLNKHDGQARSINEDDNDQEQKIAKSQKDQTHEFCEIVVAQNTKH